VLTARLVNKNRESFKPVCAWGVVRATLRSDIFDGQGDKNGYGPVQYRVCEGGGSRRHFPIGDVAGSGERTSLLETQFARQAKPAETRVPGRDAATTGRDSGSPHQAAFSPLGRPSQNTRGPACTIIRLGKIPLEPHCRAVELTRGLRSQQPHAIRLLEVRTNPSRSE